PEVVKGELCGENADVWAAGCILEQMATLGPPVYSTNVPSLATEIVGAVYEPVPEGLYSENKQVNGECSSCGCLTPDAEALTYHHQLPILSQVSTCISFIFYYSFANFSLLNFLSFHLYVQVFSLNDNQIDIVDNSSSSSSSNLEELKQLFTALLIFLLPSTALAGIAVSQGKVHQISDPVQQILHKIIFSTKLPPALQCNLERSIVERFKKSLFSQKSNPCKLESEIKKVWYTIYYLYAAELIEPNIFITDWHGVRLSSGGNMLLPDDRKGNSFVLYTLIEEALEESGYYSFSSYRSV
uniref:Protein kinase domain-containing protein n=1 Tax=Zonotrichia albicollis TaxID=44394 RepID=A0A8D2LZG1_ZONAL